MYISKKPSIGFLPAKLGLGNLLETKDPVPVTISRGEVRRTIVDNLHMPEMAYFALHLGKPVEFPYYPPVEPFEEEMDDLGHTLTLMFGYISLGMTLSMAALRRDIDPELLGSDLARMLREVAHLLTPKQRDTLARLVAELRRIAQMMKLSLPQLEMLELIKLKEKTLTELAILALCAGEHCCKLSDEKRKQLEALMRAVKAGTGLPEDSLRDLHDTGSFVSECCCIIAKDRCPCHSAAQERLRITKEVIKCLEHAISEHEPSAEDLKPQPSVGELIKSLNEEIKSMCKECYKVLKLVLKILQLPESVLKREFFYLFP